MTLVKSLHSGDPDAMGMLAHENMMCYSDYIRVKPMCHTDEHMHWESHVDCRGCKWEAIIGLCLQICSMKVFE
jgi:hypothetical protein